MRALLLSVVLCACSSDVLVLMREPTPPAATSPDAQVEKPDAALPFDTGAPVGSKDVALGASFDHTCAAENGRAFCWGRNDSAQLGLGDTTPRNTPSPVNVPGHVLAVCAGETHSCALTQKGELHCWGKNLHGELGVGDFMPRTTPAAVGGATFSRIACGGASTCGIRSDGALFCWGDNFEGKIGQDDAFTSEDIPKPTRVVESVDFRDVSVGQGHVCAVDREGALYCWGRNNSAQLGLGMDSAQVRKPSRVGTASDYLGVAAAQHHTCAVRRDGTLECWGSNAAGELGIGSASAALVQTPTKVMGDQGYHSVRANWFHTCALRTDGSLDCWGRNEEGQLGLGDNTPRAAPTRVDTVARFTEVSTGHFHTCAFGDGQLWCWGENNELGQLGIGMVGRKNVPTQVPIP
jgi:alpha-tubulin suppressor-like RCC1 family protein